MSDSYKIWIVIFFFLVLPGFAQEKDETPALLFRDVRSMMEAASLLQKKGESKAARDKYRSAAYLLDKIRQDFPEWNPAAVKERIASCRSALGDPEAGLPPVSSPPITCYWNRVLADSDFVPEEGKIYKITLEGEDKTNLRLGYERLKSYPGEARICLQARNTPKNIFLLDQKNQGLFRAERGEFNLSLSVPSEWPIFLAEYTDDPYADPVVLSNIVELP